MMARLISHLKAGRQTGRRKRHMVRGVGFRALLWGFRRL